MAERTTYLQVTWDDDEGGEPDDWGYILRMGDMMSAEAKPLEQVGWRKIHVTRDGPVDDIVPMGDSPFYSPEFGYEPVYGAPSNARRSNDG